MTLNLIKLVPIRNNKYRLYVHSPVPIYGIDFQVEGGEIDDFYAHRELELSFHDKDSAFFLTGDHDPFPGRGIVCQISLSDQNLGRTLQLNNITWAGQGGAIIDSLPDSVECETNPGEKRGPQFREFWKLQQLGKAHNRKTKTAPAKLEGK